MTVIKVVIDSMAGYAFAKMRFAGRDGLFALVLLTLMVPFSATLIPLYIIVRELNMTNTYWGLILPPLASPIGIFMMRQFIETLAQRSGECGPAGWLHRVPDLPQGHSAADANQAWSCSASSRS